MASDGMRELLVKAVPLNGRLGIEIIDAQPGRGVARLPDRPELKNHVGSQHAAALYGVGEAASGAAVVPMIAQRLGEITPLARSAEVSYTKVARGVITATAAIVDAPSDLLAKLDADGRVAFPVQVTLTDTESQTVATMTVQWHLSKRK